MKTSSLLTLAASLGLASAASAQVLMFDFGPTTASGASLTNSPYHTANNTFTGNTWNKIGATATTTGVPDPSSGLSFSDGSNAVFGANSVTLNLGAATTNTTTITLATQPGTSSALGNPTNSGIYADSSVGKDAIFTTTNGATGITRVGAQIGGLAVGTYDIYVTARNTNTATSAATYSQTVYAGISGAAATFDYAGYSNFDILTYTKDTVTNAATIFTSSWVEGDNYVKLSVSITAANQFLNLAVAGGGSENRGFLNSVQIVNTTSQIPEPSSFAALAGLAGLGLAASRRRRV